MYYAREECPSSRSCHLQPRLSRRCLYPSAISKNRFVEPLNRPALTGGQLSPILFASSISSTYGLMEVDLRFHANRPGGPQLSSVASA